MNARKRRNLVTLFKEFAIDEEDYAILEKILSNYGRYPEPYFLNMSDNDDDGWVHWLNLSTLPSKDCPGLPEEIAKLSSAFQHLKVGSSLLLSLTPSIGQMTTLESLDLSGSRKLSELPEEIGDLSNLTSLDLSSTNIKSLPASVKRLRTLESLNLGGCRNLLQLPEVLGDLVGLTKLDLYNANITSLPPWLGRLKNLKVLDLGGCRNISQLPDVIGELTSLTSLDLNSTELTSVSPSIGKLRNLDSLNLGEARNFSELPDEIGELASLTKLYLYVTNITSLPPSIGRLRNLQYLGLYGCNKLRNLPDEIGQLSGGLLALNLGESSIESLPGSIGNLSNLRQLNLRCTQRLLRLPIEIGKLSKLKSLILQQSAIESLPSSVVNLTNLEVLDVRRLRLVSLPDFIGGSKSLRCLYISGTSIPELLGTKTEEYLLMLLEQRFPSLVNLDPELVLNTGRRKLLFALANNRARTRFKGAAGGNLWPLMLCNAERVFDIDPKPAWRTSSSWCRFGMDIRQHDAIYWLLQDGRESFVRTLLDRNTRPVCCDIDRYT